VLHRIGLGPYAAQELREERHGWIRVVRIDLAHVVPEVGKESGNLLDRLHVFPRRTHAPRHRARGPADAQPVGVEARCRDEAGRGLGRREPVAGEVAANHVVDQG
jgi:hypothetical protein